MRRMAAVLALCFLVNLAGGCFVLDEIDEGQALMDKHADKDKRRAQEEQKAQEEALKRQQEGPGLVARLRGWWDARQDKQGPVDDDTGPPPHPDDVLGRCEVGGSTQFLRKFDCQIRGGRFKPLADSASR